MSAALLVFCLCRFLFGHLVRWRWRLSIRFETLFTHLPQVFLAAAFGWAIPMAYVAVSQVLTGQTEVDIWCWLLFVGYMCWTVAYDTQYAMADREDDLKIGVKSTAILFGKHDVLMISLLQGYFCSVWRACFGIILARFQYWRCYLSLPCFIDKINNVSPMTVSFALTHFRQRVGRALCILLIVILSVSALRG